MAETVMIMMNYALAIVKKSLCFRIRLKG